MIYRKSDHTKYHIEVETEKEIKGNLLYLTRYDLLILSNNTMYLYARVYARKINKLNEIMRAL